jgi:GT2 family glycosyltransferase
MRLGVVIPVGPRREENYRAVMRSLEAQTVRPHVVVTMFDGTYKVEHGTNLEVVEVVRSKHYPGMEHPRNLGVRELHKRGCDWAWFLDSDVIVDPGALAAYRPASIGVDVLIGPYEWLPPSVREPMPGLRNDPRWAMFDAQVHTHDLAAGLACFGGNLVWRIEAFMAVGGFWNELHAARVEDGELGARACALGVPMRFVAQARGWHMHHDVDHARVAEINAVEVPMIDARHPWIAQAGVDLDETTQSSTPPPPRGVKDLTEQIEFWTTCWSCDAKVETREWWWHVCT